MLLRAGRAQVFLALYREYTRVISGQRMGIGGPPQEACEQLVRLNPKIINPSISIYKV